MDRRTVSLAGAAALACAVVARQAPATQSRAPILDYIKRAWATFTRSNQDLVGAAVDSKQPPPADGRWPVYISRTEDAAGVMRSLRAAMKPPDFEKIEIRTLPAAGQPISEYGLLYLPQPYVVSGSRFNEMYGWDSFFITMGLIRDGDVELALDMADNLLYEIRRYGKVLNANRTYYLERSQPPFVTGTLLQVYGRTHDRKWRKDAIPAIEQYYRYWTSEPHLTPETGLSRYYDLEDGPAPEVVAAERDPLGKDEYDLIREYLRTHRIADYDAGQFYDAANDRLTAQFFKGDRSMRESGFDPSNRFGPFSADIVHYNPACLNALLYLMEIQTAEIIEIAGRGGDVEVWRGRARRRASRINRYLWDPDRGMYFDYNFESRQLRRYPFLTTFYPLWVGVASQEQASLVARSIPLFKQPGGLQTSTTTSGDQWDAPFGWAPLQWIAVRALRRYGYDSEAEEISKRFLSLVLQEYGKRGEIMEKYDVMHRRSDVARRLIYGYHSNEAGFGWTNAVFTALFDDLPSTGQRELSGPLARAGRPLAPPME